jgi:DNA-binding PadR family transcriptional regulator
MPTQTLRSLERDGLISRHLRDTRPLSVEYSLTELGMEFLPVALALKAWSERHLKTIEALVGFRGGRAAGGAEGRAERLRGCPPASRGAAHASLGEPAVADR